ncbi:bifunctional hydroxymethylpyrimidine kinase/phosphomethylpyrimidine kinase, partial [Dissulfurirhabdus thermomarina]
MIPVLTIAGSDPGGGAGLQQDLKVFTALGAYGAAAPAALTAQDTRGVAAVAPVPADFVRRQVELVLADIAPAAVKTGMLGTAEVVAAVAGALAGRPPAALVVDPVLASSGGVPLLADDAVAVLRERLCPLATVVTPNLPEAEVLLGRSIPDARAMEAAAAALRSALGCRAVLLKGGHLDDPAGAVDAWADAEGTELLRGRRIETPHTHGTGCTLSAALAVFLARGLAPREAARRAKAFLERSLEQAVPVGRGRGPANPVGVLEAELSRYPVLQALEAAWRRLAAAPSRVLVPEVQINLGYALPGARSVADVAAFPGRIVGLGDGVARVAAPAFGASSHVARIVLTAMRHDPECRAAMNIRHDEAFLHRARDLGWRVAGFSRRDEPEESRRREGSTLAWGVDRAIRQAGAVPDLVHDPGDVGKEPIIRILGPDPESVVAKALRVAGLECGGEGTA